MVKQRWWGCVGHEMNQGERCVYSKSRKQRWSQIDGRWKRWRGSVYKRSDAAQSVLVMTQLTPHIATNPSSSCFPSLLSRLPLSLAPSLRLCDAVKIYSCNWLPIVCHTGLQIMTNLELSCRLPSWFRCSLTLIDTAVVVFFFFTGTSGCAEPQPCPGELFCVSLRAQSRCAVLRLTITGRSEVWPTLKWTSVKSCQLHPIRDGFLSLRDKNVLRVSTHVL